MMERNRAELVTSGSAPFVFYEDYVSISRFWTNRFVSKFRRQFIIPVHNDIVLFLYLRQILTEYTGFSREP